MGAAGQHGPAWAFAGSKPQGVGIVRAAVRLGYPPVLWILPESLPDADGKGAKRCAEEFSIPLVLFQRRDGQALSALAGLERLCQEDFAARLCGLDLLVTCRFPVLPRQIFSVPRLGAINVHSSLLPCYRGVHPVSWALIDGAKETGITIHRIDKGIDTGAILHQTSTVIQDEDDLWSLTARLDVLSAEAVGYVLSEVAGSGCLPPAHDQIGEAGIYARRRRPEDGRVDPAWPARRILNLVRALPAPLPPAFLNLPDGNRLDVHKARPVSDPSVVPSGWHALQAGDGQWLALCPASLAR